jgi:glycolate oxidase FAD binding subunit
MPSASEPARRGAGDSASLFDAVLGPGEVCGGGGLALDGVPVSALLRPADAQAVADCLAIAARHGVALVARGSGTKLGWGNPPRAKSLVLLELARLDRVIDLSPAEGVASVGAGLRVSALAQRCAALGRRTLLDGLYPEASVGGTVAVDPLGCQSAPGRELRGDLLGLEVALANGTLTRCGGRVVKNVTGFDLPRLYCGSLGTLGVITAVTLRLRPEPALRRVLGRELREPAAALAAAQELLAARVPHAGLAVEPGGRLLWLLEGAPAEIEEYARRFPGESLEPGAWDGVRARRIAPLEPHEARLRLAARPSDVGQIAELIEACAGAAALELALPAAGALFARVPAEHIALLAAQAAQRGWLCSAEAAPLAWKEGADVFAPDPATLPLARALKQRFDPESVLAPGRFQGRI